MTKVLVTGGTGFIGSDLVKRLVRDGYQVRVLDDNSRGDPRRLESVKNDIELMEGDVRDADFVMRATEGMEVVFHLAAVNGTELFYSEPDRVLDVGVKGAIHTMDAAIKHGARRYLFASSSETYQEPTHIPTSEDERLIVPDVQNPRFSYGGEKIIGELLALHYLKKHNVEPVIFRPHNVFGPDMGYEHVVTAFIKRLKELSEKSQERPLSFPIQGDGSQTRAFSFITDAVEGIMLVAEKGKSGEIYNVGDAEETTIQDLVEMLAKIRDIQITTIPGEMPKGGTLRRCPDIRKLCALGYKRQVSLQEGLERTCEAEWKRLSA